MADRGQDVLMGKRGPKPGQSSSTPIVVEPEQLERIRVREAWGQKPKQIAEAEGVALREVRAVIGSPTTEWLQIRDRIRDQIVQTCYDKANQILGEVTVAKAKKESNPQVATTAAILIDKAQLLEGRPTSIVGEYEFDVAKLLQPDLLKQLIELRGGIQNLKPEYRALAEKLGVA